MSKNRVTGKLLSAVSVRYLSQKMDQGRYTTAPAGSVPANTDTQIFVAEPLAGALPGAIGENTWMAADGTIFRFTFNNSRNDNEASSNMSDVGGAWVLPKPDYPSTGWDWTVTYKIDHEASFYDAPVFADDILKEDRCDTFGDDVLKRWIGDHTAVTLGAVLAAEPVPLEARLWCAAHRLFLTARSKHLLMADLARSALVAGPALAELATAAAALHEEAAGGEDRASSWAAYRQKTQALVQAEAKNPAFGALSALAGSDPDSAWSNAVHALIGAPGDPGREEAIAAILATVETRL